VADLSDACSDWLTISLQLGQMSPTNVTVFWGRRHVLLTSVADLRSGDPFFESVTKVTDLFLGSANKVGD